MGRASRRSKRAKIPARPTLVGPNAAAPSARDVPRIRAQMAAWAADTTRFGAGEWLRALQRAAGAAIPGFTLAHDPQQQSPAARWAQVLPAAELFYVAANLSTLVHHAAETLTGYDLHPDDLPARSGFMLFAEPLRDTGAPDPAGAPISLVTWAPMGNSVVIEFWMPTSYAASADLDPVIGFAIPGIARTLYRERHRIPASRRPAQILPTHGYLYQRPTAIPFGGPVDVDYLAQRVRATHAHAEGEDCEECRGTGPASGTARLQRLIVATWLLMGQSITAETRLRPQPAVLGATSAPPPLTEVRYVELRTIKRPPNQDPRGQSGAGRVYRHSWLVRGHWRRQWYPSRGEHRPVWINPHLAGPDGAPLIGGERVNVLRR